MGQAGGSVVVGGVTVASHQLLNPSLTARCVDTCVVMVTCEAARYWTVLVQRLLLYIYHRNNPVA